MNAIVAKVMEAIAKLPDAQQESIGREMLGRIEEIRKRRELNVRAWLDDVQSHFEAIEIPERQQPPMPANSVTLDG